MSREHASEQAWPYLSSEWRALVEAKPRVPNGLHYIRVFSKTAREAQQRLCRIQGFPMSRRRRHDTSRTHMFMLPSCNAHDIAWAAQHVYAWYAGTMYGSQNWEDAFAAILHPLQVPLNPIITPFWRLLQLSTNAAWVNEFLSVVIRFRARKLPTDNPQNLVPTGIYAASPVGPWLTTAFNTVFPDRLQAKIAKAMKRSTLQAGYFEMPFPWRLETATEKQLGSYQRLRIQAQASTHLMLLLGRRGDTKQWEELAFFDPLLRETWTWNSLIADGRALLQSKDDVPILKFRGFLLAKAPMLQCLQRYQAFLQQQHGLAWAPCPIRNRAFSKAMQDNSQSATSSNPTKTGVFLPHVGSPCMYCGCCLSIAPQASSPSFLDTDQRSARRLSRLPSTSSKPPKWREAFGCRLDTFHLKRSFAKQCLVLLPSDHECRAFYSSLKHRKKNKDECLQRSIVIILTAIQALFHGTPKGIPETWSLRPACITERLPVPFSSEGNVHLSGGLTHELPIDLHQRALWFVRARFGSKTFHDPDTQDLVSMGLVTALETSMAASPASCVLFSHLHMHMPMHIWRLHAVPLPFLEKRLPMPDDDATCTPTAHRKVPPVQPGQHHSRPQQPLVHNCYRQRFEAKDLACLSFFPDHSRQAFLCVPELRPWSSWNITYQDLQTFQSAKSGVASKRQRLLASSAQ